jgi:hypothetical protein
VCFEGGITGFLQSVNCTTMPSCMVCWGPWLPCSMHVCAMSLP